MIAVLSELWVHVDTQYTVEKGCTTRLALYFSLTSLTIGGTELNIDSDCVTLTVRGQTRAMASLPASDPKRYISNLKQ